MKKDWLIIVNPNAGSGKGERDWKHINDLLLQEGFSFQTVFTSRPKEACEIAKQKRTEGFTHFIAAGGDGTLNEVINGLLDFQETHADIKLGCISIGTGNDWGRSFGIPTNYAEAIRVIKQGYELRQDIGQVSFFQNQKKKSRYFMNMAGLGFDASVALKTNQLKEKGKSGLILYIYCLVLCLFKYRSKNTKIKIDKQKLSSKVFSMSVGIGQYNGGGMQQAPNAIPNDGLFDLTVINKLSKLDIALSLRKLYNGTLLEHPKVDSYSGKSVKIETSSDVLLEVDGESLGHGPFEFSILPQHLRVIVGSEWCKN